MKLFSKFLSVCFPACASRSSYFNFVSALVLTPVFCLITFGQTPATAFDFDADGKADISVFRSSDSNWYILNGNSGILATQFGMNGDEPVSADYDGDGKYDRAIYRNGVWWRLMSATNTVNAISLGLEDDIPVPAQFDGDGMADVTVYRPSTGTWYWINSSGDGTVSQCQFGLDGDIPLPADYDGDGKADINVFRPSDGFWYRMNSSNSMFSATHFGQSEDTPLRGDFDGDGKTDISVWRPSTTTWYIMQSSDSSPRYSVFGLTDDIPVPADYDGDGKADVAVFRPTDGAWHRLNSSDGSYVAYQFGLDRDIPIPAADAAFRSCSRRHCIEPADTPPVTPTPASPTLTPTPTATNTVTATMTATSTPTRTATSTPTRTATNTPTSTATATSTPTNTPTVMPSSTPSATPTPPAVFTCDYYASTTGTASGSGTAASPWDLQTALKSTLIVTGKTLCVQGGVYRGKYKSTLNGGGTVRSAPGQWAIIDGYVSTTLTASIDATQTTFTVADASVIKPFITSGAANRVMIDGEALYINSFNGNTITANRAASGTTDAGAQPHAAGTVVRLADEQLWVAGNNTTYRDLEIMTSSPFRNWQTDGYEGTRGSGVIVTNFGNKLVDLVIHDNLNGIFNGNSAPGTEVYGCLIFNNGMINGTAGNGHGMYLENGSGTQKIWDNMILNNYNLGTQLFGVTGSYIGGNIQGNVYANNGSPLGGVAGANQRNINLLVGTDSQRIPDVLISGNYFFHPQTSNGSLMKFGYGAGVDDGTVSNNVFVGGGGSQLEVQNTSHVNVTGNKFFGTNSTLRYAQASNGLSANWNNNTYYKGSGRSVFTNSTDALTLPQWRSFFGFDASSTETTTNMPDMVVVRPNSYQAGRANIIVYAVSGATSVNVDISAAGLANGQGYTIRSAFNYSGTAVSTGVYNTASPTISLPLTGSAAAVASPLGATYTPPTTLPQFGVFILIPN